MGLIQNSGSIKRSPLKRGKTIKKVGERSLKWKKFRNEKFDRDKNEEGLIKCQDTKVGLPHCGISRSEMDLHHLKGRDGDLLTDERWLVWLTRECHDATHNPDSSSTSRQTKDDTER